MKKIWILTTLLIGGLLLAGCNNNEIPNDKQLCLDQRNTYLEYVKNRENIDDNIPSSVIYSNNRDRIYRDLWSFDMFYSDVVNKCIAWYYVTYFENNDSYMMFYMYDALNDKMINWWTSTRWNSASEWFFNDLEYYRTWKWELADRDPSWMPYD